MFDQLPQLQFLGLGGNLLSGRIPTSLFKCKQLQYLYLFNNQFEGNVPPEIGNLTWLKSLGVSDNSFTGDIPSTVKNLVSLQNFNFSSNNFTGRLPTPPPSLNWLFVSENKLVGKIPSSICNLSSLKGLELSYNNLGGVIPKCVENLSSTLLHIDLRMNEFNGTMPRHFPKGCSLRTFSVNNNQLEGSLPPSLLNCRDLKLADLGNNKLHDTFPNWLGKLELQVLVLRSNRFYGRIDDFDATFSFSQLRILDLSDNSFIGNLPRKLFENLNYIKDGNQKKVEAEYMGYEYYPENKDYFGWVHYDQSIYMTTKGLEREFVKILTLFTAVDFSNNGFSGQIPEVVGELHSLILLNLSHNSLVGPIPPLLGNLSLLESLDLSSNKLQDRIPVQLKNLIFLAVLNLSHNNLTGPIPQGNQFDTFTSSSYDGNLDLCGFPLSNNCSENLEPPTAMIFDEEDDITTTFNWRFALLMGYGCGLVLGFSMGYIVFTTGKPRFFIRMVQRAQEKYVKKGKIRRSS